MPNQRLKQKSVEILYDFSLDMTVPGGLVDLLSNLHPLTACVVWEVLTGRLTPAVVELAQASPDVLNFQMVDVVARADPDNLAPALEEARRHLAEIFLQALPDDPHRLLH